MTEEEKLNAYHIDCVNCGAEHSLKDWQAYGMNSTGIMGSLKLELEEAEDIIEDVMMDCPSCGDMVYLSDGSVS
tara:strand:- start:3933 stop:4154 length:222 start_codon:yes stop_codon:yes gene_type:complete